MYYNFYYKLILINYFNNFNKNLINYFCGIYNENEFKIFRLQYGIYRQKNSYMCRFSVHSSKINFYQFIIFSYLTIKYDKNYLHITTRTNIQFNWLKLFYIFEVFKKLCFLFLHSIQTSGNCVRNITSSFDNEDSHAWSEIIRQWFNFNFEFLFLPRKFKVSILSSKKDNIVFKTHDLGLYLKKNNLNVIKIKILIGGGLGRTPLIGFYILKNIHWKNIINYSDKILRIYNIYGFRNNIYKSRLKILCKSLKNFNFLNFINKEFNFSNNLIYFLNEKEINIFFIKKGIFKKFFFHKKLLFNFFFLNWLKSSYNNLYFLSLKNNNKPPGDINFFQIKILYFFFNFYYLKFFNRQNIIFFNFENFYFYYLKLKKYFFNIFNINLITDTISCPGKDYCVLANSKSISVSKLIHDIFIDFNSIYKIGKFYINISGCVNSCGHHHVSNIGLIGVNKNNLDNYQLYIGGNFDSYDSLSFSKVLTSSFLYFKISYFLINILKIFLNFNNFSKNKNTEKFDFFFFKSLLIS